MCFIDISLIIPPEHLGYYHEGLV